MFESTLRRKAILLVFMMFVFSANSCGSMDKKSKAVIENIMFCEEPDASNLCDNHTSTFSAGIVRVYASADIKLTGANGTFDVTWSKIGSGIETIRHKTILTSEEGTGKIAIDIFKVDGLDSSRYRLQILFESEDSEGEAASDFIIAE